MKKIFFLLLSCFVAWSGIVKAATMNDYCMTPTFVTSSVKPNIMIVMDFSGSMQFPAYTDCIFSGYEGTDNNVAQCGTPGSSASNNYSTTRTYSGLFDTSKYFKYASPKFQVNTACTDTNKIGSSNTCISGNLLNWIAATRIDVIRKVLTGGRTGTGSSDTYQSEGARVTYTDTGIHCKFTITGNTTKGRTIAIANESGHTCPMDTLSASNIDIVPQDLTDTGIIQDFYDKVSFEFMVAANDSRVGKMISGKNTALSSLVPAIFNQIPYSGTPTGNALWEAHDFFKQHSDYSYYDNSSYISSGDGSKDPYYDGSGSSSTAVPCRKTFILLLSDGAWNDGYDPVIPVRTMHTTDLRSNLSGTQNVITYVVYAFGDSDADVKKQGRNAMITTAIFGGFDFTTTDTWPYPFTGYSDLTTTCSSTYESTRKSNITDVSGNTYCNSRATPASPNTYPLSVCDPAGTWNSSCKEWDKNKTGLPYNFFEADDGDALTAKLYGALNDMISRASSGTAASVLASSEGSGANLLQAVFYPRRILGTTEIVWTGEVQDLWYYIDPFLQNSTIREDTDNNKILHLTNDYVIQFYFDSSVNETKVKRYSDTNGDGAADNLINIVDLEEVKNLWAAGILLSQRNLSTSPRTIYTTTDGISFLSGDFSTINKSTLRTLLQASDDTEATKIINYIHGIDQTGYRDRTYETGTGFVGQMVWRLGDIISSTPRLQSSVPLNTYHLSPPDGYLDATYSQFIQDNNYLNRGMAYVGANDGMYHAFKLGKLEQKWDSQGTYEKARLTDSDLGKEQWAFIPKNTLPYLKYMADPNYCHLYYIDIPAHITDASTGGNADGTKTKDSWKTILIGGMGIGGACRNTGDSCTDCVKTPINGVGFSSYFALDVTNPNTPTLLWEFSHTALGFSTSGPVVIRVGSSDKNGKWFVVFASGPTGPIDTTWHQFLGKSDQNLKLFVLDLKTGAILKTIDTGIENAFAGSLFKASLDTDRGNNSSSGFYNDDVFYLGYTKKDTATSTWTKGGVLRVITKEDPDPNQWSVSKVVDDIGPVTSAIAKLQDRKNNNLWLYFGTGRFFYKLGTTLDDPDSQQAVYGIKEPCYSSSNNIDKSCSTTILKSSLTNQTTTPAAALLTGSRGWFINLDASSSSYKAERVITDPLAVFSGITFFTTFSPSADVCALGGNTNIWATKYDTGYQGASSALQGKAIVQVSTGEIKELTLSSAFTEKEGRRSAAISGMPPKGQGLSVLVNPKPLRRILHIQEK